MKLFHDLYQFIEEKKLKKNNLLQTPNLNDRESGLFYLP